MAKIGNTQEEARINSILSTEKYRYKYRRLRCLQPRSKGEGVNRQII